LSSHSHINDVDLSACVDKIKHESKHLSTLFNASAYDTSTGYDDMIKEIHKSTNHLTSGTIDLFENKYFMIEQFINEDSFDLLYKPDSSVYFHLNIMLNPTCKAGEKDEVVRFLSNDSNKLYTLGIRFTSHFSDVNDSVNADGACSVRALYILYCNHHKNLISSLKDCNIAKDNEFQNFKKVIKSIEDSIPASEEQLKSKFKNITTEIYRQYDIPTNNNNFKLNISKRFWLKCDDMINILRYLDIKVAVYIGDEHDRDKLRLIALTKPYESGVNWSIKSIQDSFDSDFQLINLENHFYVSTQRKHALNDVLQTQIEKLGQKLIDESSNQTAKPLAIHENELILNDPFTTKVTYFNYFFKKIKRKYAPDGLGTYTVEGIDGNPTPAGMMNFLKIIQPYISKLDEHQKCVLEFGSSTGISSLVYFASALGIKVWGYEVNDARIIKSLNLHIHLKEQTYINEVSDFFKEKKIKDEFKDKDIISQTEYFERISSKVSFNYTKNISAEDLLNRSKDWKTSIFMVYAFCDGVDAEAYQDSINIWNQIESLKYIITDLPQHSLKSYGFNSKKILCKIYFYYFY
jgi:hypothetical protein